MEKTQEKAFRFDIHLKDPDANKIKAMLGGIQAHFSDTSMMVYETMVVVVETDRPDVAEMLKLLNTPVITKNKRTRKPRESNETAE